MDVAVHFEKIVARFTRYHKYTPGTEPRNTSRQVVAQIVKANAAHDKPPELLVLRERLLGVQLINQRAQSGRVVAA